MGCIFSEMLKRQPLFVGKDGLKILTEIFCRRTLQLNSLCLPDGLDLLSKMLCLCPNSRISADEALDHPYFRPSAP
ncbi:cyclin-dependent kinase [Trifolium repens]|nr:cyclin-dependent kinase [Trifolium repens]